MFAYLDAYADLPNLRDESVESMITFAATLFAALLVLATMISALIHVIANKNWRWLFPIVVLAYVGAYFYGFVVASNPKRGSELNW